MRITSGLPSSGRPARTRLGEPEAGAESVRSSVGSAWRERTSARGLVVQLHEDRHASTTSFASAGRKTNRPGIARSEASCSTG